MIRDLQEIDDKYQYLTCATVHQFQGSEKPVIIFDAVDCFRMKYPGTLLTKIKNNTADRLFNVAMAKVDYKGDYNYCYCTKSSHFSFVLEEALKNDINLETSSAYDIHIIRALYESGVINKDIYIICNGFKRPQYVENIADLINDGFINTIPVVDNKEELNLYDESINKSCNIGIRIAAEEEPKFDFYTSRLGIRYNDILDFYLEKIKPNKTTIKSSIKFC